MYAGQSWCSRWVFLQTYHRSAMGRGWRVHPADDRVGTIAHFHVHMGDADDRLEPWVGPVAVLDGGNVEERHDRGMSPRGGAAEPPPSPAPESGREHEPRRQRGGGRPARARRRCRATASPPEPLPSPICPSLPYFRPSATARRILGTTLNGTAPAVIWLTAPARYRSGSGA
jgi:hypothetical protein